MKWSLVLCVCFFVHFSREQGNLAGLDDCPLKWYRYEDKCYSFDPYSKTLVEAKQYCVADGARLLSVNTPGEHEFVATFLKENKLSRTTDEWWTSGEREAAGSTAFKWSGDNTILDGQEHWLDPSIRARSPGLIIVYATQDQDWGWSLADGSTGTGPSICEISLTDVFKITSESRDFNYGVEITDATKFELGPSFVEQPADARYNEENNKDKYADLLQQYAEFECFASGNPIPIYKWYKLDGNTRSLMDPLTNSKLSITNGRLRINKPTTADADFGFYQCEASNKFGAILSNNVSLSFVSLGDFPRDTRVPVSVGVYDFARLDCGAENIARGYDRLLYSWFKDYDPLNNNILPDSKPYTFIDSDGTLHFSSVTQDDAGHYTCQVTPPVTGTTSGSGKTSQPISLNINEGAASKQAPEIPEKFPKVWPTTPLVGKEVMLECIAYGTGTLNYRWERVGSQMPTSVEYLNRNRIMLIPKAELIHSGMYRCLVDSVIGTDATGDSDFSSVQLNVQAAPAFTIPLENEHVDLGSNLIWRCNAEGDPAVTYTWYKNAKILQVSQLELDPKFQGRYTINRNELRILQVQQVDSAMYQCTASNRHGHAYSSAQLRVLSFAPSFTKYPLPARQYATRRGTATMICSPESAPRADIQWQKNGRDIDPSTNNQDSLYRLPNGNLVFNSVSDSDAGNYTCIATNIHGEARSSGELAVLATTTITTRPQDITLEVNQTGFLHCEASFNPALDITYDWYQNNRKIDFERIFYLGEVAVIINEPYFERGSGPTKGGLYIRRAQYFHAGNYTCIAKTSSDSSSRSAKVTVTGAPYPPVGVRVVETSINATSLSLHWSVGYYSDNGEPITKYYIEKNDLAKGVWEPAQAIMAEPDSKEALVYGLSPYSNHQFRIRAENALGIGDPSDPSEGFTTSEGLPLVAPTNIRRCIDKVGTLCIKWDCIPVADYDGLDFNYVVKWKQSFIIDEEFDEQILTAQRFLSECKYVVLVGDRNFFKDYDVVVLGYNRIGRGPASEEAKLKSSMGVPDALPFSPTVWQVNATAILVEWTEVDDSDFEKMKGTVSGYRINYWRRCCEERNQALFKIIPGQTDHGTIIGLYPDTIYQVEVQVFNEAGLGPKTDPVFQLTLRAAPKEAPQEVRVFVDGPESVRLSWRGVDTTVEEEPVWGYEVLYWKSGENRNMAKTHNAGRKSHTVLSGLEQDTLYYIRVAAYSRGGVGLLSSPTMQVILGRNCQVTEDSPDTRYVYRCRGEEYFESLYFNSSNKLSVPFFLIMLTYILQLTAKLIL